MSLRFIPFTCSSLRSLKDASYYFLTTLTIKAPTNGDMSPPHVGNVLGVRFPARHVPEPRSLAQIVNTPRDRDMV